MSKAGLEKLTVWWTYVLQKPLRQKKSTEKLNAYSLPRLNVVEKGPWKAKAVEVHIPLQKESMKSIIVVPMKVKGTLCMHFAFSFLRKEGAGKQLSS